MLTRRIILAGAAAMPAASIPLPAHNPLPPMASLRAYALALAKVPLSPVHSGYRRYILDAVQDVAYRIPGKQEHTNRLNAICGFSELIQLNYEKGSSVHKLAGRVRANGWGVYEAGRRPIPKEQAA